MVWSSCFLILDTGCRTCCPSVSHPDVFSFQLGYLGSHIFLLDAVRSYYTTHSSTVYAFPHSCPGLSRGSEKLEIWWFQGSSCPNYPREIPFMSKLAAPFYHKNSTWMQPSMLAVSRSPLFPLILIFTQSWIHFAKWLARLFCSL